MRKRACPWRCVGCSRRFPQWSDLREHHKGCLRFIERQDGVVRTRASKGRVKVLQRGKEAL